MRCFDWMDGFIFKGCVFLKGIFYFLMGCDAQLEGARMMDIDACL